MNGFPQYLERLGRWVPSPVASAPAPPPLELRTPVARPAAGPGASAVDALERGARSADAAPRGPLDRQPRA